MKKFLPLLFIFISIHSTYGQSIEEITALQSLSSEELSQLRDNPSSKTTYTGENSIREVEDIPPRNTSPNKSAKKFGSDIFDTENLTFAPSRRIPTPQNYTIAAGDELIVTLWGSAEAQYTLRVTPEGNVTIPQVGLLHIGSLTIEAAEKLLKNKLSASTTGLTSGTVNLKITLGDIRSITVNVVGEALQPGTYTLPSLATLLTAIYSAGGVSEIGSLRNIKLYRAGQLATTLDIYDYLLSGRSEVDLRLEDNDLIVVNPYSALVEIKGTVKRPMTYELLSGETLSDLIEYAGGFIGDAYSDNLTVVRKAGGKQYSLNTVPSEKFDDFLLLDSDEITVGSVIEKFENRVTIEGAVWREGDYELSEEMNTLSELIAAAEGVTPDAFMGRGQIIRTQSDNSLCVIPFNLQEIFSQLALDIALQSEDRVVIASIEELKEAATISIEGEVNSPLVIPYIEGMTIEDIIFMAGGFKNSASLSRVEIARRVAEPYATATSESRAKIYSFSISEELTLEPNKSDFVLEPFDMVFVRRSPAYSEQSVVTVEGEVNFEGEYVMVNINDRLSNLVAASGGVTPEAYVRGARLRRFYTPEEINRASSLTELASVTRAGGHSDTIIPLAQIKSGDSYTVGINLERALADTLSSENLVLRAGDRLIIPTYNNTITISGAVYWATTTTYSKALLVKDYIRRAGGYSSAAKRKPFVIEANGSVLAVSKRYRPEAGSEIVIPYKPYREPLSTQGWIGISTSIVSMAAMIISLL